MKRIKRTFTYVMNNDYIIPLGLLVIVFAWVVVCAAMQEGRTTETEESVCTTTEVDAHASCDTIVEY
jgi:hypothetical protein